MSDRTHTIPVKGLYRWESFVSYDNRLSKSSKIERTERKEKEKRISSKTFISKNTKTSSKFEYKGEASAALDFNVVKIGADVGYSTHLDAAMELVHSSESSEDIFEKDYFEVVITVEPGDSLVGYRLCYAMDGVSIRTDITAFTSVEADPPKDIFVDLEFDVRSKLLGFREISDVLLNTYPGSSNMAEWQEIREKIISISSKDHFSAFFELVETLSHIEPKIHNKLEWHNIRKTCAEILNEQGATEPQLLLLKLLTRFSSTYPRIHNKAEWQRIRTVSNDILNNMRIIY